MDEELKQFFQPWEIKIIEIIEEAKKEEEKNIKSDKEKNKNALLE